MLFCCVDTGRLRALVYAWQPPVKRVKRSTQQLQRRLCSLCFIYCLFSCIRFVVFVHLLVNKVDHSYQTSSEPGPGYSSALGLWPRNFAMDRSGGKTTSSRVLGSGGRTSHVHHRNSHFSDFSSQLDAYVDWCRHCYASENLCRTSPPSVSCPHPLPDFDSFNCITVSGLVVSY